MGKLQTTGEEQQAQSSGYDWRRDDAVNRRRREVRDKHQHGKNADKKRME
jgi:hypothetical protein